jgi:hypothetical protein
MFKTDSSPAIAREQRRAQIALAVMWAVLALVALGYAIARGSLGAVAFALVVAWLARLAWSTRDVPKTRAITFLQ